MGMISVNGYAGEMPRSRSGRKEPKKARKRGRQSTHPNRIAELAAARGLVFAEVGEKIAERENRKTPVHETTIARLSSGEANLTVDWMERLAPVFDVTPAEIKWPAPAQGLRRVRVRGAIQAGSWAESHEWPAAQQYDVMVRDDPDLRQVELYAGEILGLSMNLRYAPGTVVVMSNVRQGGPDQIKTDRYYHVRRIKADGLVEETIKKLVKDDLGRYWLKPESSDPEHQGWLPLEGMPGDTVELIGRVRFAVQKEPD